MKRHINREQYFYEQYITSWNYIVPFIGINNIISVLEIGCGEGGTLKPFYDLRFEITGIDIAQNKIDNAKIYLPSGKFLCVDISLCSDKYDLIIVKDTLEHIHGQERFIEKIKTMLNPNGKVFFAFPPWYMPFAGHQQMCRSVLRFVPYIHLLPFYKSLLNLFNEDELIIDGLLEIKQTRITIKRFKQMTKGMNIIKEAYWLINPNYEVKFGLKPIRWRLPFFKELVSTYYCLLIPKR